MTETEWNAGPYAAELCECAYEHKDVWKRGVWGRKFTLVWCHTFRMVFDELVTEQKEVIVAAEDWLDKTISQMSFNYAKDRMVRTLHWSSSKHNHAILTLMDHATKRKRFEQIRHYISPFVSAAVLRDIFGNPFRSVAFSPAWRTSTAIGIATLMYDTRNFGAMPILADALQDAGCEDDAILSHCRDENGIHVRGCWVVDLVLGKS
jgi:hypothetical protein